MGNATLKLEQELTPITCVSCGMLFAVPAHLEGNWRRNHTSFACPLGHRLVFDSETNEEKLRKENERLRKEKEWAEQARRGAEDCEQKTAKKLAALRKRVGKGVCPCCKRTVSQLARHMDEKHPGFGEKAS